MDKFRQTMQKICDMLEVLVAVLVGIAFVIALIMYVPHMLNLIRGNGSTELFLVFVEQLFNLVVGIEFMKLLCKPSTDHVIEIVIFLVARHMILSTDSALDIFLSVLSIALLCVVRKFSRIVNEKWPHKSKE